MSIYHLVDVNLSRDCISFCNMYVLNIKWGWALWCTCLWLWLIDFDLFCLFPFKVHWLSRKWGFHDFEMCYCRKKLIFNLQIIWNLLAQMAKKWPSRKTGTESDWRNAPACSSWNCQSALLCQSDLVTNTESFMALVSGIAIHCQFLLQSLPLVSSLVMGNGMPVLELHLSFPLGIYLAALASEHSKQKL